MQFEWRFYALSASKAIFKVRTSSRVSGDDDWLRDEWN